MASSRDMNPSARPLAHRPSLSNSSSTALPGRSGHARNNSHSSHSLLTNSLNPNHRVTRRKSVTGPNANLAAVTAHLHGNGEKTAAVPIAGRRNTFSKGQGRAGIPGSLPSPPASLPGKGMSEGTSAIDDANELSADDGASAKDSKARVRRASEGQQLTKAGKKGAQGELTCQHCGKGYKHSSCLTKHLWEHTPEWSLTSKLLISKHQQVQLLEAATVLVKMTGEKKEGEATPPESTKDSPSDVESAASPDASAYSEQGDRLSSADTTPPPMAEGLGFRNQRHSSMGHYSRSYQSAPSAGSLPYSHGFGHARNPSDTRPPSSGVHNTSQEDMDLAAGLARMSGSLGSNQGANGIVTLADAPPVPAVPAQYRDQQVGSFGGSFMNSFPGRQPESFTRGAVQGEDVQMGGHADSVADEDDFDMQTRGVRSDEEDDGVFGKMEE